MNGNDKLLSAMRRSKYGWKWRDLERLYKSFGFLKREGGQHTIYWSPRFPMLRALSYQAQIASCRLYRHCSSTDRNRQEKGKR